MPKYKKKTASVCEFTRSGVSRRLHMVPNMFFTDQREELMLLLEVNHD